MMAQLEVQRNPHLVTVETAGKINMDKVLCMT